MNNNDNNINGRKLKTSSKEQNYLQKRQSSYVNKHNKNEYDYNLTNEEILLSKKLLG